jgi:hypothetical protein
MVAVSVTLFKPREGAIVIRTSPWSMLHQRA